MKTTIVRKCGDCPFWNQFGSERTMECIHPFRPKGAYENLISWGEVKGIEPLPKFCPLKKEPYTEDKIVNGRLFSSKKIKLYE
jgi:hypothetical protein